MRTRQQTTARKQVIEAANEHGWETSRGFSSDPDGFGSWAGSRAGSHLNLEFSSKGSITWGWHSTSGDKLGASVAAPDRLAKVLEILKAEQTP